jgi:hypothetical protein
MSFVEDVFWTRVRFPPGPPMKHFQVFSIPIGVFGILNVESKTDIYTYQFIYGSNRLLEGPDWYSARHYLPDLIEVPQLDYGGTALAIKDWIKEITSEKGYYAILSRSQNLFGLAWAEKPFIAGKQEYVT